MQKFSHGKWKAFLELSHTRTATARGTCLPFLGSWRQVRGAPDTIRYSTKGVRRLSTQSTVFISALVFGGAGSIIAYLILYHLSPERSDWHALTISSGAAAFAVSCVFWRVFCSPSQLISGRRGALVGVLTGILTHPVAWYLAIVWSYASGARSSLGDRTLNPLQGLTACFVYAFLSILVRTGSGTSGSKGCPGFSYWAGSRCLLCGSTSVFPGAGSVSICY